MPVSPQDFALWSDLTGNPYPRTPAEQMALAPEVYSFTRNLGRRGGPTMSPLRRAVDVIGKAALGAGALAGAAYLGKQLLGGSDDVENVSVEDLGTSSSQQPTGKSFLESKVQQQPKVEQATYRRDRPRDGEIEEDIYAPRLTRGELTDTYPTELTQSSPLPEQSLVAGETYRPSGTPSTQITSAWAKAIRDLKTEGAQARPAREPYPQLSEAEKEAAYSEIGSYGPYAVGREHEAVSRRAEQFISRLTPGFTKLEVDNEVEVLTPVENAGSINAASPVVRASGDITPATSGDNYGQKIIPGQTAITQEVKGLSSIKPTRTPIETKPVTQSEVIASQQSFSPGSEIQMIGEDAAQKAAAFRKSAAYAAMQKQNPTLRDIESPTQPASSVPVVLTDVRPSPQIQSPKERESPIASMSRPAAVPVTEKVEQSSGPTASEIRDLDALLLRSRADLSQERRNELRDQVLSKKYKTMGAAPSTVATAPQPSPASLVESAPVAYPDVISGPSPESVRFAREAARGMSRVGLMSQREAGRASLAQRAQAPGGESMSDIGEESRELADPRVMREMMRRPAPSAIPSYF